MKALKADDKKLTKWIKNLCKSRKLPEGIDPEAPRQYKLEDSIGIDRCEISLVPFVECLIKPGEASQTLEFATELRSAGYPLSAETFVQGCLNELALAKLSQIIPYMGNFQVLEKWRKVTKKLAPAFSDELRALLAESPSMVALEWLLQKAKPEALENEYRWLLAEIDCSNAPAADLLAAHLSKDPKGVRLQPVQAGLQPSPLAGLGHALRHGGRRTSAAQHFQAGQAIDAARSLGVAAELDLASCLENAPPAGAASFARREPGLWPGRH